MAEETKPEISQSETRPQLNRRRFLGLIGRAAGFATVASIVDPEVVFGKTATQTEGEPLALANTPQEAAGAKPVGAPVAEPQATPENIHGFRMPLLFDSKLFGKDFKDINPYVYTQVGDQFDPSQFADTFVKQEVTPRGTKYSYQSAATMDPGAMPMHNTVTVDESNRVVDTSIYTVLADGFKMIPYENYKQQEWFVNSQPKYLVRGSLYHGNDCTLEIHAEGYALWRDKRFVRQVFALPEIPVDDQTPVQDYIARYQDLFQVGQVK